MSFIVLYKDFLSKDVIYYKGNLLKNAAYIVQKDNRHIKHAIDQFLHNHLVS